MIKLGVLGSTKGTDLQAIIDSIEKKELIAKIAVVISNKEGSYILERAKRNNIPFFFLSHKGKSRKRFDQEITTVLKESGVDLILLNVHPSLLPKYAGGVDVNVHEEVLRSGEKETGCTIHFVTEDVDRGPILIQKKCNVDDNDTVETLKAKVQALEGEAFIESIQLIQNNSYVR